MDRFSYRLKSCRFTVCAEIQSSLFGITETQRINLGQLSTTWRLHLHSKRSYSATHCITIPSLWLEKQLRNGHVCVTKSVGSASWSCDCKMTCYRPLLLETLQLGEMAEVYFVTALFGTRCNKLPQLIFTRKWQVKHWTRQTLLRDAC